MNLASIFSQMAILMVGIALGFLACKCNIMDGEFVRRLSKLVLHITTPAMVLHSVIGSERVLSHHDIYLFTGVAFATYAVLILVSFVVPKLLRVPAPQKGVYRFMTIFSNSIFMGFPVVRLLFGAHAVFYAAVFNIPFILLSYAYGIYLVSGQTRFSPKLLISPAIISILLAYVLYLFDLDAPQLLIDAADFIGQITTPAAMLIIGATLAGIPLRSVLTDVRLYAFSLLKLIVLPVALWAVLRLFVENDLIVGVTVVLVAMPAATNATMMCAQYGGDADTAARGIFISTVLSIVTIPLIMWLLFS